MTKKSIQFDLDDPRSGKIASAMGSKTAKKILNALADGEKSSSDVAEELSMPLNTVTYNLKKLVGAGLVNKSKRFFWSSKGKRIELYSLSNRRIVISPKMTARNVVGGVIGIVLIVVIATLLIMHPFGERVYDNQVKQFNSLDELRGFIESAEDDDGFWEDTFGAVASRDVAVGAQAEAGAKADTATDYSTTNIQVEGVDEPDFLKNDGKYIYVVSGGNVLIVDAYPAEGMEILGEINLSNSVSEIFVNGDKLVLFSSEYRHVEAAAMCTGAIGSCGGYSDYKTIVYVYDVSDKENPELDNEIVLDG